MNSIQKIFSKLPGFSVVRDRTKGRDAVSIETKSDDQLLSGKRAKLIASHREEFRNTTFSPATALQFQINVVGTVGGRLTVLDYDGKINESATKQFRRWARHAEFTRGTSLNDLLGQLIKQLTHLGGDFIAVLDRGELTNANNATIRVKIFEPDQIRNIPDADFKRLYPEVSEDGRPEYTQLDGIVKNAHDQVVGAFVGNSRGEGPFNYGEYLALERLSVPGDFTSSNWVHVGALDRPNQHRGISPLAHVANTLADAASMQGSEVQAAKLNAGLGLVFTESNATAAAGNISAYAEALDNLSSYDSPSCESGDANKDAMEEIEKAEAQALKDASTKLADGQSAVVRLRPNTDLKSFSTERPNLNVVEFYDRTLDISGTVFGLPQMYTRLKSQQTYSGARAEMAMARPVFDMWKKILERYFLDWLAVRVLDAYGFTVDETQLLWSWPEMDEVDEGSHQTALQKKFLNGEINLISIHGADTEKFLDRRAYENQLFKERGLTPPWNITTSGSVIQDNATQEVCE